MMLPTVEQLASLKEKLELFDDVEEVKSSLQEISLIIRLYYNILNYYGSDEAEDLVLSAIADAETILEKISN